MSYMDPKNLLAIVYQHLINIFSDFADGEAYTKFTNCEKPFFSFKIPKISVLRIYAFCHVTLQGLTIKLNLKNILFVATILGFLDFFQLRHFPN